MSSERLHVLRIYERLPPEPGGMERHIAELTTAQRKLGVKVTNIYNLGRAEGDGLQILGSLALHRLRPSWLRNLVFYGAIARHRKVLSEAKIDVVHAHGGWSAFMFAQILARAIGAPVVAASLHDAIERKSRLYKRAMRGCDPIFATGLAEAHYLQNVLGPRVYHLPSAPAEFFFSDAANRSDQTDIIVVGNLVPKKRTDLVLQIASRRPQLRFSIYGEGPEIGQLAALQAEAGLANVTFHGSAPIESIHSAMHSARLFLNVSQFEGSPTTALEAMACGLPVVLTPANDYSAIVQADKNGIVTRGWDCEEIAAAIDQCLADEDRRRKMGEKARKMAEGHRWEAKAKFVTEAMMSALEKRTG